MSQIKYNLRRGGGRREEEEEGGGEGVYEQSMYLPLPTPSFS